MTAKVVRQHAILQLELRHHAEMPPGEVSAESMNEHDVATLARLPVVQRQIVDFDFRHRYPSRVDIINLNRAI
jgi:hypothetical protein